MEELIGNIAGARQVFERWMSWEPDDKAWSAYIKLEERYQEWERVSGLYERLIGIRPEPKLWVKWARYEEDRGKFDRSREIFQMALEFFGDSEEQIEKAQSVFNAFAKMETRAKEYGRARVIYKYALSRLPKSKSADLFGAYTRFEKQYGSRSDVEATVLGKRRLQYEAEVTAEPSNYDTWFEYLKLEEYSYRMEEDAAKEDALARTRELYERAVSQVPPSNEKRHWRRYIFIWLSYAIFEEADVKDFDRARIVYQTAVTLVPHKQFTFAKLWNQYARFEIRRLNLSGARKIFGQAIGVCPKERLFKAYIDLEFELREFDRIRALYEKYLEFDYSNCSAWIRFAQLEAELGDTGRARSIFELAVGQDALDMPERKSKSLHSILSADPPLTQCCGKPTSTLRQRRLKRASLVERLLGVSMIDCLSAPVTSKSGSRMLISRIMRLRMSSLKMMSLEMRRLGGCMREVTTILKSVDSKKR